MAKKEGKGGGARKYGQNRVPCDRYKVRERAGDTPKMRRIAKKLKKGIKFKKWDPKARRWADAYILGSNGKAVKL